MTQAVIYAGLDLNKDRYFPRGVTTADALNLFVNPQQIGIVGELGGDVEYVRDTIVLNRRYYYTCTCFATPDSGIQIGSEAVDETSIFVTAGQQITIQVQIAGSSNYTGETIRWQAFSVGGASNSATVDCLLTNSFQTQSVTFTPDTDSIVIDFLRITTTTETRFIVQQIFITPGASMPSILNTGYISDAYEDITDYVTTAQWNNGMDDPQQQVAGSAQLTLTLNNQAGYFNQEGEGADQITNGTFTTWTGGLPAGWAYSVAETPGFDEITEVGFDSLYGGTGADSCNYYTTFVQFSRLYQNPPQLVVGTHYRVEFDIGACSSGGIRFYSGANPISQKYSAVGHHVFEFYAPTADFSISSDRAVCNITFDNVTCKEIPRYAGLKRGTLISLRGYNGSDETQLYTGRLEKVIPLNGVLQYPAVSMVFSDAMNSLGDIEYTPRSIQSDVSTYQAIINMFSYIPLTYPYISDYWVLGQSVLGVDTWLFQNSASFIGSLQAGAVTNNTTLTFEGDIASNRQRGIVVSSYIRDIMAAEFGRFHFHAREGFFNFTGRNADNQLITATYTLTNDDYEPPSDMVYADDIINQVTIWYKQRRLGSSSVVLWASDEDIVVEAKSTKRITGRYRDPDNEQTQVSSSSFEPFVGGVDYVISPNANNVTVTAETNVQSVTFSIRNDKAASITLTTLQIRGVPIYAVTEQSVSAQNAQSIYDHNQYSQDYNIPLLSDPDDALGLASGIVGQYANPITRIRTITFQATKNSTRYVRALTNPIGKRINITQSFDNHDAGYVVIGEKHNLIAGEDGTWEVTWVLKPIDRVLYWYLGEVGRSELGITTTLAF